MKAFFGNYWPLLAVVVIFGAMIIFDGITGNFDDGCKAFPWFIIHPCHKVSGN